MNPKPAANPLGTTITTARLRLAPIALEHAPAIFASFDAKITRYMMPAPAGVIGETEAFIRDALAGMAAGTNLQLVILDKGTNEFLGCCGLHGLDQPVPEAGLWLKAAVHGKGYGREAIAALVTWAQTTLPAATHIRYPVDKRNRASRRIPEFLGGKIAKEYRDTALGGQELDQVEYHIPLDRPLPKPVRKHGVGETLLYHLLPGLALAGFVVLLSWLFRGNGVPAFFFLALGFVLLLVPSLLLTMKLAAAREGLGRIRDLFVYRSRINPLVMIGLTLGAMFFAALVFMTLGSVITPFFRNQAFGWLPAWLDVSDLAAHPGNYAYGWVLASWLLGLLVTSTSGPVIEELYFRGFLLPRIPGKPVMVVTAGVALFALYHLFSPWMAVTRAIALVPMVYFVWRKRNLGIGIAAHVLLNLAGDTIPMIPLILR